MTSKRGREAEFECTKSLAEAVHFLRKVERERALKGEPSAKEAPLAV